jgi:soluble lytic murein transglycosylase-like protein
VVTPPPVPAPPPPDKRELAKQALAANDPALLRQAAEAYPEVAPWLKLRIGDAAALTEIIQQTPASSAATVARIRLAGLQPERLADTDTIPIDELTEEDFVNLGKALPPDLANKVRLRLLMQFPQGRFTEQTYDFLAQANPSPLDALTLDESLRIATQLGRFDRYDRAFDMLRRINARFPNAGTSKEVRAVRYRALFNSRQYDRLLAETDPAALTDPDLILLRARAAWRAGRPKEFLAGLDRVPQSTESELLRSKYYSSDEINYDIALLNLERAVDAGAIGNEGENLWTLGWTYYLAKRSDDALATFKRYALQFPDGDYLTNSLFWSGKIYEQRGERELRDAAWHELESKFPYSWYSYRARELAGEPVTAPNDVPNGNVFPDVAGQLASINDPRLVSIRELMSIGLYRDAVREMKIVAAAYPDNAGVQFMLADLYVQGGEPFKANGVLQRKFRQFVRHGGSGVPHRFWEILFPLSYFDTIKAEAEKRQLDPYLIASIIRQETGFEPTTVSNAGAVGIMQIMPAEAATIAAQAGLPTPTRQDLFDPKVNIAIGAAEFAQKLAALNGNPILAIAAYNAGTDVVGKWIAQQPVDDVDSFTETIPYAETRLYVKTVSRNRFEYRRIYEGVGSTSQQSKP